MDEMNQIRKSLPREAADNALNPLASIGAGGVLLDPSESRQANPASDIEFEPVKDCIYIKPDAKCEVKRGQIVVASDSKQEHANTGVVIKSGADWIKTGDRILFIRMSSVVYDGRDLFFVPAQAVIGVKKA